jgi:signal transduction histidine kinase
LPPGLTGVGLVLAINAIAFTLCLGVFVLFRSTLWRKSTPERASFSPPPAVVLGGAILGALKAGATSLLSQWWLSGNAADFVGRVTTGAIIGVAVVITVPILLDQLEVYREQRATLLAEVVRHELATHPNEIQENTAELNSFIKVSLATLSRARAHPDALPRILDDMRENQIRPLSHKIWQRENRRIPDFTVTALIVASLSRLNFVVTPVLVVFAGVAGTTDVIRYGLNHGLTALVSQLAIITVVLVIAKRLPPQGVRQGLVIYFASAVVSTGLIAATTPFIVGPENLVLPIQANISILLLLLVTILASAVFSLTRQTHKSVTDDLIRLSPQMASTAISRASQTRSNREFAALLHSQVQNVFLARSIQIREVLESKDVEPLARHELAQLTITSLEEYLRSLAVDLSEGVSSPASEQERLEALLTSWDSVITIELTQDRTETEVQFADVILGTASEAIANAVKHGLARVVTITILHRPEALRIEVNDDGVGPRSGPPGLGAFYFDSIPNSRWSLTRSTTLNGARLTVEIFREAHSLGASP